MLIGEDHVWQTRIPVLSMGHCLLKKKEYGGHSPAKPDHQGKD